MCIKFSSISQHIVTRSVKQVTPLLYQVILFFYFICLNLWVGLSWQLCGHNFIFCIYLGRASWSLPSSTPSLIEGIFCKALYTLHLFCLRFLFRMVWALGFELWNEIVWLLGVDEDTYTEKTLPSISIVGIIGGGVDDIVLLGCVTLKVGTWRPFIFSSTIITLEVALESDIHTKLWGSYCKKIRENAQYRWPWYKRM